MDFNYFIIVSFVTLSHLLDSYFENLILEFNVIVVVMLHFMVGLRIDFQHFLIGLLSSIYWQVLINFRLLANKFHHQLVYHYRRILEMGIAMDWFQRFISNFLFFQHHMHFRMDDLIYQDFQLLFYYLWLALYEISKMLSSNMLL